MKDRLLWLDNLKGCLILIVVLGHTILFTSGNGDSNIAYRYICSFWMAVFMFTSGFACYRPSLKLSSIKKRFLQLIIPFIAWSFVLCVINQDSHLEHLLLYPTHSVWFLWALFFIYTIVLCCNMAATLINIREEYLCAIVTIVLFVFAKIVPDNSIFALNLISMHLLNYAVGFYSRKKFSTLRKVPSYFWYLGGLMFIILAYFNRGSFVPFGFSSSWHIVYDELCGVLSLSLFIPLFIKCADCQLKSITKLGGYAWNLYLAHCNIYRSDKVFWWVANRPSECFCVFSLCYILVCICYIT